jgi:hypothetical protein
MAACIDGPAGTHGVFACADHPLDTASHLKLHAFTCAHDASVLSGARLNRHARKLELILNILKHSTCCGMLRLTTLTGAWRPADAPKQRESNSQEERLP